MLNAAFVPLLIAHEYGSTFLFESRDREILLGLSLTLGQTHRLDLSGPQCQL